MTARREPSTPPTLPGYDPVRLLGMGGFADVFLYEQRMPRRSVAVKVLLAGHLGDDVRARFRTEADTMARLSHHPSIVTIHHADVAADGRPFLVMEYCARPGLGQRYRSERIGVAEVLRIGVRLASAVETAHRAGVLHRDIKPANVLITDFGWPALTDFGIAATTSWAAGSAVGMSIPWSPPEMLAEHPAGDARADVYSLAATVYSLLARRSPFEVPGAPNGAADLIPRIERGALVATGRGDVPETLEAVLRRAMDVDPRRRHHSAFAFARALQQVEAELLLPLTPLDLPEEPDGVADDDEQDAPADGEAGQATRLRPVPSIAPEAASVPSAGTAARFGADRSPHAGGLAGASAAAGEDSGEVLAHWRAAASSSAGAPAYGAGADPTEAPAARGRRRVLAGALAGAAVVAVLAVAAVQAFTPADDDAATAGPTPAVRPPAVPVIRAVPAPADLTGVPAGDGTVVFTWTNPEPEEGDRYVWGVVVPGRDTALAPVDEPSVTVPASPDGPDGTCVEVALVRQDGRSSTQPAVACAAGGEASGADAEVSG
ncbi:serine/threonine-protein kinase [Actinotalea sp. Marseille-Q4924]|uniref:serine/threonine-protein kinase n=1 Tax=Actinotalea sp. Marseille-Q4924 TaxID=2866571 RepID=UPI001CE494CA|nr:serine/threonine-protein kinase [Actinotalea sp. Marseille-Q4924]